MANRDWRYGLIFAVPNGSYKSKAAAVKFKREGLKSGVPDLCLPVPTSTHHGLFIELKRQGGVVTDGQLEWLRQLNKMGYKALVCYGAEEATEAIDEHIKDAR